jgi:ribulose-5-phosphate 4-epimerase/fuculose-1-phosphate aldolase
VIHAHPPAIVALTAAGVRLEPIVGAYDPAALDTVLRGISYYERSILIETMELGRAVAESMGQHNICLLKGHGVAITGHDVQDAVLRAVALNELARITLLARSISSDRDLELLDEQDLRFWSDRKSDPRRRLRADGQRPEWWYLRRQLKPRR